jgi:hypothetical protein
MKTKEEIEQLAENNANEFDLERGEMHYGAYYSYIEGYTQCQKDMAYTSIRFAEWVRIKDFQTASRNNWIGLDMKYYTTKELFEQFKNSLNKNQIA